MRKLLAMGVAGMLLPAFAQAARFTPREVTGNLNLNTATQKELELLPGVGPKTAKKIIEYRTQKPFAKSEDVRKVKGVGRGIFAKVKGHVSVEGPTTLTVVSERMPSAAIAEQQAARAPEAAPAKAQPKAKALPRK